MVERRKGGETGVKWLQAYRGDKFWDACRDNVWPRELDERGAVPEPYADAGARRVQRYFPVARRYAAAGEGSGGVSL